MDANDFLSLQGRIALITGGGQGVGRAVSLLFAEHGAAVVVNDYHQDRAESVAKEILAAGGTAIGTQCNITRFDDLYAMVDDLGKEFGPVDVRVTNVATAGPTADPLAVPPPFWETG